MLRQIFISFLFCFVNSQIQAQNHIEKRYWDNLKLHPSEIFEALPDGTYNGYRKTYTWDGIQDLNFVYKKGVMLKKQELAKDGKTIISEINADSDGNFHGLQFAKSYFTPGTSSFNIKANFNHGEMISLERFDEKGKVLEIQNNKVKGYINGTIADEYSFSTDQKLITGKIVEETVFLIIKQGKIDSVINRKTGQIEAYRQQDGLLTIVSLEKARIKENSYLDNLMQKAEFSFTTSLDLQFNGNYKYGLNYTNIWGKTKEKASLQFVREFEWENSKKGRIKTEEDYTKNDQIKVTTYADDGNVSHHRIYKIINNRKLWIEYDSSGNEINSLLKMEERERFVKDSINEIRLTEEKNRKAEIQRKEDERKALNDSISNSLIQFLGDYFSEKGKIVFMGDSGFYNFCVRCFPNENVVNKLFTDSTFAFNYIKNVRQELPNSFNNPNLNSAYEYIANNPPKKHNISITVEDIGINKEINYRERDKTFTYNNIHNKLNRGVKMLKIDLVDYSWSTQFYFLDNSRWVWIENNWYFLYTGPQYVDASRNSW